MNLDEALALDHRVPDLSQSAFDQIREQVRAAAGAEVARTARAVRARKARWTVVGLSVAGLAAVAIAARPSLEHAPDRSGHPPVTQVHYRTVAQIVGAASVAPSVGDPSAAPYWKVVRSSPCRSVRFMKFPARSVCSNTTWWGNGRPSLFLPHYPGIPGDSRLYRGVPGNTYVIDGRTLTWQQINARSWTMSQIAQLAINGTSSSMPRSWAAFAGATDLLADAPASDTIRKQLWQYLGTIPGIRMDGKVTDATGRVGWRISLPEHGETPSVIIDPASGLVLEEENLNDSTSRMTITFSGPVNDAPSCPKVVPTTGACTG